MHLIREIKDIKTDTIGVVRDGKGIKTVLYGNEINAIKMLERHCQRCLD